MTARVAISIRRAEPDDRTAVLALLATALGWRADEGLAGYFDWKHHENPLGPSPVWVALAGEQVVGFRTLLRWEFEDPDGKTRRAVRAVDTATHPDFQGQGVFRSLTLAAIEEMADDGVEFVFNTPNDKSRPGYLSMGWVEVGRLAAAVRVAWPSGAVRMLRARVPADRWPRPGGGGAARPRPRSSPTSVSPRCSARSGRRPDCGRTAPPSTCAGATAMRRSATARSPPATIRRPASWCTGCAPRNATEAALCEMLVPHGADTTATKLYREVVRTSGADYVLRLSGAPGPRAGFVPLPGQGPVLTWRALAAAPPAPPLSAWRLSLGDVELL